MSIEANGPSEPIIDLSEVAQPSADQAPLEELPPQPHVKPRSIGADFAETESLGFPAPPLSL